MLTVASIMGIVAAYPVFWLLANGSQVMLYLGFFIGMTVVQSAMYGPSAAFISEMFRTEYRYTGASIGYQIAATLGAGVSPLIAVTLATTVGWEWITVYIAATFVLSLVIVRLAQEGTKIDLRHVATASAKA
jgi:MFS transporter, MHS family, shikimate and dehydroshikimate transport protein